MNLSGLGDVSLVNNTTANEDDLNSDGQETWVVLGTLMMIAGALVLALNSLCLIVLHRTTVITEPTKVFMISLNTSDLLLGAGHLLPTAVEQVVGYWPFGDFLCQLYTSIGNIFFDSSLFSLLLLTIDRYIGTFFPLRYPSLMTVKRSRLLVCAVWILLIIQAVLIYLIVNWQETGLLCLWQWEETQLRTLILAVQVLVPTIVITVLYIKMMLTALRHAKRIHQEGQIQNHLVGNRSHKAHRKSLTTVTIVTATLYLSLFPMVIIDVMKFVFEVDIPEILRSLAYLFFTSNSWLNVIIYFLRNKELRKEALKVLKC